MIQENLVKYFESGIRENWNMPALSNYGGKTYTYSEIAREILRIHLFFEKAGVRRGDKVALVGKNSVSWAVVYLGTITYGAVIVPILADFSREMILEIINHSDSVVLFFEKNVIKEITAKEVPEVRVAIGMEDSKTLFSKKPDDERLWEEARNLLSEKLDGLTADNFVLPEIGNDTLGVISYTSGTTGNSKGVMLSHNSLAANIRYARNNMPLESGDALVSFLPLAHAYGCAFEFLFPFTLGCHVTFLTRTPSPQIITRAFAEIHPRLILSVPLVIEKIYKKQILPALEKPSLHILLRIPLINKLIYRSIRKKIYQVFGGNFHEVVIGGAAFNPDAEKFFTKIRFPFAIGYGMTECGPLISYSPWHSRTLFSCGRPVDTLEVIIDSENPEETPGEILVRGDNVMNGYYKNEEATRQVIDKDGWLHTGDLGTMDTEKNIYIRGRSKNMILGSSGQNIYPEEIESALNNYSIVGDSLVVERDGKIVALIYPDQDTVNKEHLSEDQVKERLEEVRKDANKGLPSFMNIHKTEIMKEDFERTPKRNIRRVKYS